MSNDYKSTSKTRPPSQNPDSMKESPLQHQIRDFQTQVQTSEDESIQTDSENSSQNRRPEPSPAMEAAIKKFLASLHSLRTYPF